MRSRRSWYEDMPVATRRSTKTPWRSRSPSAGAGVSSSSLVVRAVSPPRGGGRCRRSQVRGKKEKVSTYMQRQQRRTPGAWKARTNHGVREVGARLQLPEALRVDEVLSLACCPGLPLAKVGAVLRALGVVVDVVLGAIVRSAIKVVVSHGKVLSEAPSQDSALVDVVAELEKPPACSDGLPARSW